MKYIVRHYHAGYGHAMYMVTNRDWTRNISEATIHNDKDHAVDLAQTQYPKSEITAWINITILEYTDREYFKAVLKG